MVINSGMAAPRKVKVRSWPASIKSHDSFQVFMSSSNLSLHNLNPGDICSIHTSTASTYQAIAWPSPDSIINMSIIQISKDLQGAYRLKLGDEVSVTPSNVMVGEATEVVVRELVNRSEKLIKICDEDRLGWAWAIKKELKRKQKIAPGLPFGSTVAGEERFFEIVSVNDSMQISLCSTQNLNSIRIADRPGVADIHNQIPWTIANSNLCGLDDQIQLLNYLLSRYSPQHDGGYETPSNCILRPGCIVLHGARGTGKTTLLHEICTLPWRKVYRFDHAMIRERCSDFTTTIRIIICEALQFQPSIIVMDNLEEFALKDIKIAGMMSQELEKLAGTNTLIIAATPSLSDIDPVLRGMNRFDLDINIPSPDPSSRAKILKIFCGQPKHEPHTLLDGIARRTHGFVGGDLGRLVRLAAMLCPQQPRSNGEKNNRISVVQDDSIGGTRYDFSNALLKIRPSALPNKFVDMPTVGWGDLGGQHELKGRLEKAVIWPNKV